MWTTGRSHVGVSEETLQSIQTDNKFLRTCFTQMIG